MEGADEGLGQLDCFQPVTDSVDVSDDISLLNAVQKSHIYIYSSSFSSTLGPRLEIYLSAMLIPFFFSYDEVRRELPPTLNHNMVNLEIVTEMNSRAYFPTEKEKDRLSEKGL